MSDRETGVAQRPCPGCGKDLEEVQQPDGSVTTVACSSCHRPPTKANQQKAEKEVAALSSMREQGTDTSNTDEES